MSSFIFYILGGFLQSKKQALRTSPTNRGSSVVKTSFLLPKFCKQNLLRLRFGTAFGRFYNPCRVFFTFLPQSPLFLHFRCMEKNQSRRIHWPVKIHIQLFCCIILGRNIIAEQIHGHILELHFRFLFVLLMFQENKVSIGSAILPMLLLH